MENINYSKVKGTDNYFVSNDGNVFSQAQGRFKKLKTFKSKQGYLRVNIKKDGKWKQVFVHRLVIENLGRELKEGEQTNHIDGDKTNNNIKNLEIVTRRENALHSNYVLGNYVKRVLQLNPSTLEVVKYFPSIKRASESTGISAQSIGKVCLKDRNYAGGYVWCYAEEYDEKFKEELKERSPKTFDRKYTEVSPS